MGFQEYFRVVLKEGMTTTNLNITKIAAILFIVIGLNIYLDATRCGKDAKTKETLGIVTMVIGVAYAIYTLVGGVRIWMM